ncbi:Hypothetical predicted protein [Pelobates cultripes]|uniref:Uncharacterized protein n=1 Tax=Pelobates cultripes TaxID=61616 RepID=A0AAD1QYF9_PELCU|nr:Hypothetical predicted protein [Pelobates cultripes]
MVPTPHQPQMEVRGHRRAERCRQPLSAALTPAPTTSVTCLPKPKATRYLPPQDQPPCWKITCRLQDSQAIRCFYSGRDSRSRARVTRRLAPIGARDRPHNPLSVPPPTAPQDLAAYQGSGEEDGSLTEIHLLLPNRRSTKPDIGTLDTRLAAPAGYRLS